ncbi:alanine racemase [Bordetella genomosp. 10]|uniref:Alanine racemase n=1 Tax=Bordetella genomosp. 10 TaxID=1416804 RepID=A0A261S2X4_9BORD|nr:alanine racemase [Bordetella genomosp. 10]OZI31708.1 alanine racemase [Bordetella genomosp. 10]
MMFHSTIGSAGARVMARVDRAAIAHNLEHVRRRLDKGGSTAGGPRIWAPLKADAYGHGIRNVVPALAGADGLLVSQLADVTVCREAGWQGPILVLAGLRDSAEAAQLDQPGLHLAINHAAQLDWLEARPLGCPPPWIWLRYIGDLGYLGLDYGAYQAAYARCAPWLARGDIAGIGHLLHYASADTPTGIAAAEARFRALTAALPGPRSTCNSAAILCHPAHTAGTDWVRPGRLLYGLSPLPDRDGASLGLRPAMSLHARVAAVRELAAGASIGYHGAFVAPAAMRVGLVGCGYADGYPSRPPIGLPVLVNGRPARGLGLVTMDFLLVDLGDHPEATAGTPVVLWGVPELPAEHVAAACGGIAPELLTGLTGRVPIRAS